MTRKLDQFEIAENRVTGLSGKQVGEKFRGILNYQVIEKTKSYTMVKIKFISIMPTKRAF